mgnify:CR=1 FL=1
MFKLLAVELCRNHTVFRHSGSHFAASNIGFMYSLLESCKLTFVPSEKINVIEFMRTDVLNRIKETLRKVVPAGGHAFFVWLAG